MRLSQGWRTRRSGGVKVTPAVHRLITDGNRARDRRDWGAAGAAFGAALAIDPGLAHIWVQLGHAAKEAGDAAGAERAYRKAAELRPGDADANLQLGHLFSRTGEHAEAGLHFLLAFQADPHMADAAAGLHRAMALTRGRRRAALLDTLRQAAGEWDTEPEVAADPDAACLAFDVSDLVGYFAHGRAPTGIQRVQIQLITHALRRPAGPIRICCFIEGRDGWLELSAARFNALVQLSLAGSDRADPAWLLALHRLHLHLAVAPVMHFAPGSTLVNLGSSWQLPNYFLHVRAAMAQSGIRYVPFVHDLIPIVMPRHFVPAARRDVVPWVLGVLTHADHVLANSEATKRDLVRVAAEVGRPMAWDRVSVIPLDADFRRPGEATAAPAAEPFVLLVSTVESRKGHATALEAWSRLIARHGVAQVPTLVCVGRRGWLSEGVYRRLAEDPVLASRVAMRDAVSDEELVRLYQTCSFTLYPSEYEGWGLPVTESLSYGKPVIASNAASIPEAGGSFAVYVEPGAAAAWTAAIERMVFDPAYREAIAARIRDGYRPRGWADLADQLQAVLDGRPARTVVAPLATLGAYHGLARFEATRLWPGAGLGEVFRAGTGWAAPDAGGCRTRPGGGRLRIGVGPGHGALRVGLWLLGSEDGALDWCVQVRNGPTLTGTVARDGRRWVVFEAMAAPDGVLELLLSSRAEEMEADGEEPEEAQAVGLAGFFVHERDDAAAEMRLTDAILFGALDEVDAYRPPPPEFPPVDWDAAG